MDLIFSNFKSFLNAVESITLEKLAKAKRLLEVEGKNIENISDIFINNNNELFEILPDGSLVRVNLYIAIKDVPNIYTLKYIQSKDLYRYHIYRCTAITNMFNSGRKHRYKINSRDDGTFYYTFIDKSGKILKTVENQKLNICKYCLKKFLSLNYVSDSDVSNFNLKYFHKQNRSFFDFDTSSMEKGEYAKANIYSRKWTEISNQIKSKRDYTCEECGWRPQNSYEKRFIHTHHQNGDKTNNNDDNLKVLCIKCHSNIDIYHKRIKSTSNYKEFLSKITYEDN